MKMCVIGNSHLGSLAAAYLEAAPMPVELTFWGRPGLRVGDAVLDGAILQAKNAELCARLDTMGTPHRLDLTQFDAIVIVAMTVSAFTVSGLLPAHHVAEWSLPEEPDVPLVSEAALRASVVAKCQESVGYRLLENLHDALDVPIILVPQPFPSVRALETADKYAVFKRVAETGDGPHFAAVLRQALSISFAPFERVHVLEQPKRTIRHGFLSKRVYTRGARRFNPEAAQPMRDILHANAGYGHVMLRRILDVMSV